MLTIKKFIIFPVYFGLMFSWFFGCKVQEVREKQAIMGKTMGTYYAIKYIGKTDDSLQIAIEQLLEDINQSVSTYIPNSTISKVNQMSEGNMVVDQYFIDNFRESKEINKNTNGAFNPAVMPLVNYWGFGYERLRNQNEIDTAEVQRLQHLSRFDNFELNQDTLVKKVGESQLDFSGIAKGYAVDQVAKLLLSRGIEDFIIDIGGENVAHGVNEHNLPWVTGIRMPTVEQDQEKTLIEKIEITNFAVATSGNYENYHELENHQIVAHTINPKTGFPQGLEEEILSSTVLAKQCSTADAYATAFKVMGLKKSQEVLSRSPEISAFLVYRNQEGQISTYDSKKEEMVP